MKILVTGSAGFIGYHLCKKLIEKDHDVIGIDNMNNYYDVNLKNDRLNQLSALDKFKFDKIDIVNEKTLFKVFQEHKPDKVVNLAAQAGVRFSITNPQTYIKSNVLGFTNVLESCIKFGVKSLIYASSSSVYGSNKKIPFSVNDRVSKPKSIYGASKASNELIANVYSDLYDINITGLRFFTVYGPWYRPDMALFRFTKNIIKGVPISVFNNGKMMRDFTYIDDVVSGTLSAIDKSYKNEIFNLGNNKPQELMKIISIIEDLLKKKALIKFKEMQPGDVKETYADINHSEKKLNYKPKTDISTGISNFINWYREYYDV